MGSLSTNIKIGGFLEGLPVTILVQTLFSQYFATMFGHTPPFVYCFNLQILFYDYWQWVMQTLLLLLPVGYSLYPIHYLSFPLLLNSYWTWPISNLILSFAKMALTFTNFVTSSIVTLYYPPHSCISPPDPKQFVQLSLTLFWNLLLMF